MSVITPPTLGVLGLMSMSVRDYIFGTASSIVTKFFVHVTYCQGLVA